MSETAAFHAPSADDPFDTQATLDKLIGGLNGPQREAATWDKGSALVVAGAGSGKTKTLSARVAWLMGTGRARESEIMAVTFTNKAAKELLERIGRVAVVDPRRFWVGTFHGLCARFLRYFHEQAGLPRSFHILDTQDSLALLKRLFKQKMWNEEQLSPKEALWQILAAKDAGLRAEDWWRTIDRKGPENKLLFEIFKAYEQQLAQEGGVDFPELLLRSVETLRESADARDWVSGKFRHILVDEFQDTSELQYEWVKLLSAGGRAQVFAVGDDAQSIYAFRGAKIENLNRFAREFGIEKVVSLEQNYRSSGLILKAANALIANNASAIPKTLWTAEGDGAPLRLAEFESDEDEARYLARTAERRQEASLPLSELAFLYRTNAQSRSIEQALARAGIPYRIYGGLRFFERAEIKHAVAYLRLALNPGDDAALIRVANVPTRGVGAKTVEKALERARQEGKSLYAALKEAKEGPKTQAGINELMGVIEGLGQLRGRRLRDIAAQMIRLSRLDEAFKKEKDEEERLENLDELVNAAAAFEADSLVEEPTLEAFLERAALDAGEKGEEAGDAVQMMTTHSAKGLEFDEVVICGAEEGLFPHVNSLSDPMAVEEERRLMYVAITRAKRKLSFTLTRRRLLHGSARDTQPSRFLNELPEDGLEVDALAESYRGAQRHGSGYGARAPVSRARMSGNASATVSSRQGWSLGQRVEHSRFGEGTVTGIEGEGDDLTLAIRFAGAGEKRLVVKYAKLEKI
jgi:DNA helicase II / ATP-dependent DNA helicase PcrA